MADGLAQCTEVNLSLMGLRRRIMTGVEATSRIHEQSDTNRVPYVAMPAHCDDNRCDEARDAGVADCHSKAHRVQTLGRDARTLRRLMRRGFRRCYEE